MYIRAPVCIIVFILFALSIEVTQEFGEHNCSKHSRVESNFSYFCQTDMTMDDIVTMEAELWVPTCQALDKMVILLWTCWEDEMNNDSGCMQVQNLSIGSYLGDIKAKWFW